MARVTVEDCVDKIPNRFSLVNLAALRARKLASGELPTVTPDNDKRTVIALREIADETVDVQILKEQAIEKLQRYIEVDEPEDDRLSQMIGAGEIGDESAQDGISEEELLRALQAELGKK